MQKRKRFFLEFFFLGLSLIVLFLSFLGGVVAQEGGNIPFPNEQPEDCLDMSGDGLCDCIDINNDGDCSCHDIQNNPIVCDQCLNGIAESGDCVLSNDWNDDGSVDQCDRHFQDDLTEGPTFVRGDSDNDGTISLTDAVYTLNYLFLGGNEIGCEDAADIDDDGSITLTDAVYTLNYLFQGGRWPQPVSDVWFDNIVRGISCRDLSSESDCEDTSEGDYEGMSEGDYSPVTSSFECQWVNNHCAGRWIGDEGRSFVGRPMCDIYSNPERALDGLTCREYRRQQLLQEQEHDHVEPIPYVLAPPSGIFFEPGPFDHAIKLIIIPRADIGRIEVKLVGRGGVEYDPQVFGDRSMIVRMTTPAELNIKGIADIVFTGDDFYWEAFKRWQESQGNIFPPFEQHFIKISIDPDPESQNRGGSTLVPFWYYTNAREEIGGEVFHRPQIARGSSLGDGVIIPQEGESCSCSGIQVCFDNQGTCAVLPFVFMRENVRYNSVLGQDLGYLESVSGALEILGERSYFGLLDDLPGSNDLRFREGPIGPGPVSGYIPILDQEVLDQLPDSYQQYLRYSSSEIGLRYNGFNYAVFAGMTSGCNMYELVQSSAGEAVQTPPTNWARQQSTHLVDDVWFEQTRQSTSDGRFLPPESSLGLPVTYDYIPFSSDIGPQINNHPYDGSHAGFFGNYRLPGKFTNLNYMYSPSLGYAVINDQLQKVYYENMVKSLSSISAWQNTLTIIRNEDPHAKGVVTRVTGIIGNEHDGPQCGYQFSVALHPRRGAELIAPAQVCIFNPHHLDAGEDPFVCGWNGARI